MLSTFSTCIYGQSKPLLSYNWVVFIARLVSTHHIHNSLSYIEGTIPSTLGNLVQLKELFLDDNELTGSIPSELGGLLNVDYVALASNNLGKKLLRNHCCSKLLAFI
jgi:Leucine-rich repeat (LRR) protein